MALYYSVLRTQGSCSLSVMVLSWFLPVFIEYPSQQREEVWKTKLTVNLSELVFVKGLKNDSLKLACLLDGIQIPLSFVMDQLYMFSTPTWYARCLLLQWMGHEYCIDVVADSVIFGEYCGIKKNEDLFIFIWKGVLQKKEKERENTTGSFPKWP